MTGNNRSERQGGFREELSSKEVRSKDTTVGTRTSSEAGCVAISVRVNAKSDIQRKAHHVDEDGTGRKFMHLTRGGLDRESGQGVSRSHSSEEACESRWSEGLKNRRRQSTDGPSDRRRVVARNISGVVVKTATRGGAKGSSGGYGNFPAYAMASPCLTRKEVAEDA